MTADERKAWAYERLTQWLRESEAQGFSNAVDRMTESVRGLAECKCRTEHECCLETEGEGCTWVPCIDCQDWINGWNRGTWSYQSGLFELVEEVEGRSEDLLSSIGL